MCIAFALFGLFIALFNQTPVFDILFNDQIDPVFFGSAALTPEMMLFRQWTYGVLGATCVFAGILMFFIVDNAYRKKERWAWYCIVLGLTGWFVIDGAVSLYFSVYFNAAFNIVLLTAALVPLIFTKKYFFENGDSVEHG
ncbi:MAG: hypothetical protein LBP82_01180 [Candidatus Methanoplasma sp.]|nr:hypothetical protein [Candidatus Methanoplasma sp.]